MHNFIVIFIMVKKKIHAIHILIPVTIRLKLENIAYENGVTMSWIVRSILHQWRLENNKMPVFNRPKKLIEKHTDFSLKLHGNKEELLTYSRCNGGEFSSFIRYLLNLWNIGELILDLESEITVKNIKKIKFEFKGVASVKPCIANWYKKSEFWKKNPKRNISIMTLGLLCRLHPLKL